MMRRLLRRLRRDRRGNVAIVTALLMIPLIGMAGLAIDIGSAMSARASLDAAADTAALLATTVASNAYLAGTANPTGVAQTAASQRFNAQAGTIGSVTVGTVNVAVTQSGTQFTSNVTYTALYQTALGPVVGVSSIPLGGVSAASLSINPYVDIQVLMDVSASMLIAATPTDIANMQTLTTNFKATPGEVVPDNAGAACAFACHWNTLGTDYLGLAQKNGVTLRIDVLRSAVGNLITNIAALNNQAAFRLGLTTFAEAFTQIYPMSSNISAASSYLPSISPDVNLCTSNCPETYFASAMASLGTIIGTSGNGATQATSQKFLFIVSDGLVDQYTGSSRVIGPINPGSCAAIKAQGVQILTLYTPYSELPNNGFWVQNVAQFQEPWDSEQPPQPDLIQQAMSACATSPNFAFVASNSAQIDAQLQVMLATVLQTSGHFTQ